MGHKTQRQIRNEARIRIGEKMLEATKRWIDAPVSAGPNYTVDSYTYAERLAFTLHFEMRIAGLSFVCPGANLRNRQGMGLFIRATEAALARTKKYQHTKIGSLAVCLQVELEKQGIKLRNSQYR